MNLTVGDARVQTFKTKIIRKEIYSLIAITLQEREQKLNGSRRILSQVKQTFEETLTLDCGLWFINITLAPLFVYG